MIVTTLVFFHQPGLLAWEFVAYRNEKKKKLIKNSNKSQKETQSPPVRTTFPYQLFDGVRVFLSPFYFNTWKYKGLLGIYFDFSWLNFFLNKMKWSYRFAKHSFAWNSLHFLTCFWRFLSIIPSFICLTKLGIEIKTFFFSFIHSENTWQFIFYFFFAVVAFSNFAISANKYGTNDDDGLICGNFLFFFCKENVAFE